MEEKQKSPQIERILNKIEGLQGEDRERAMSRLYEIIKTLSMRNIMSFARLGK